MPVWTDEEIESLSYSLKTKVLESFTCKKWIQKRLDFQESLVALTVAKFLSDEDIGKDFAAMLAELPIATAKELRLLICSGQ